MKDRKVLSVLLILLGIGLTLIFSGETKKTGIERTDFVQSDDLVVGVRYTDRRNNPKTTEYVDYDSDGDVDKVTIFFNNKTVLIIHLTVDDLISTPRNLDFFSPYTKKEFGEVSFPSKSLEGEYLNLHYDGVVERFQILNPNKKLPERKSSIQKK